MLSNFRKKKFEQLFYHFDLNKSGKVDKKEFQSAMAELAQKRGWGANDAQYNEVKAVLTKIWAEVQEQADVNKDGEISLDEWIAMWEKYANNPSAAFDWQKSYCKLIFQLEDVGNDGKIDCDEYASFFECFRSNAAEAKEAFKKMSQGKSHVTWEEFQVLWEQFFQSDDITAPGNFIFGRTSL